MGLKDTDMCAFKINKIFDLNVKSDRRGCWSNGWFWMQELLKDTREKFEFSTPAGTKF